MSELRVSFGIPQPGRIEGHPQFKAQGVTSLRLEDFPLNVLPSGGLSGLISPSEMFMVQTCRTTDMIWKDESGRIIAKALSSSFSFIGRFPWEITMPGIYRCHVSYKGVEKGYVEFEVI